MNRPWLFLLSVFIFCLFIVACSPYMSQMKALQEAYQNGNIDTNNYQARMNELQALDQQWRQNLAQSLNQAGANMNQAGAQMQQQRANSYQPNYLPPLQPMQTNRPTYGSGTIMTPAGQTYFYNYNQY